MNPEFEKLLSHYLDDEASQEELRKLAELIKSENECRKRYQEELRIHVLLREISLEKISSEKEKSRDRRKNVKANLRFVRQTSHGTLWWSIAASFAVFAVGLWFFMKDRQLPVQSIAILSEKQSAVTVERGQEIFNAENGFFLAAGDAVRTSSGSSAIIKFTDSTVIELNASTSIVLNPSSIEENAEKQVDIINGSISAEIAKQPEGRSMVFKTHNAKAVVLGTKLEISVESEKTVLKVREGLVYFRLLSGGDGYDVPAGGMAEASGDTIKYTPKPLPPRPKEEPMKLGKEEKKPKSKDPPENITNKNDRIIIEDGNVIGKVKSTGKDFLEVTSINGKTARYIPEWKNGGYSKDMLRTIDRLKPGDLVSIQWYVNDHIRIKKIELLSDKERK